MSWFTAETSAMRAERLCQKLLAAGGPLHAADEQHLQFRMQAPCLRRERDAVETRHRNVGDDDRDVGMLLEYLEPLLTVRGLIDLSAKVLEHLGHQFADQCVIIHHHANSVMIRNIGVS